MYIAILGRQPALGMAELESLYGSKNTAWWDAASATISTASILPVEQLGGTQKLGKVIEQFPKINWNDLNKLIIQRYESRWNNYNHKITLGISVYGMNVSPGQIQATGIELKKRLRKQGSSLRLVPNVEPILNTATSHHNKLGLSEHKIELLIIQRHDGKTILAESIGAQNITALARRDQARPRTDAFVGMLPPKLAMMMINMGTGHWTVGDSESAPGSSSASSQPLLTEGSAFPAERGQDKSNLRPRVPEGRNGRELSEADTSEPQTLLDPFCGTGVILQEALLMGYRAYGTDLSEKMVDYSQQNLKWLEQQAKYATLHYHVELGDATVHTWHPPVSAVVCETYLGQPFSAPPSPAKLREVRGNCNHIISKFLTNIGQQLQPGTPLVLAVPAWRDTSGHFTHLPLTHQLHELGYTRRDLHHVRPDQLLYYREDQIVARELLLLTKA